MPAARARRPPPPTTPLTAGTRLGPYDVRNVLGNGPFGLVYRVVDVEADVDLAVKEYLPNALARRDGATAVVLHKPADAEAFTEGLRFFLNEGQLLGQLDHPALVKVHATWEQNGTAYMAMTMATGRNLCQTLQSRWKSPGEASLRSMLESLLGALELLHDGGLQHRDIAPQNIMLEPGGQALLMDLGSPRRASSARGESGATGPRDGYAPIELYGNGEGLVRGPWTDFYALAATVHFMIAGKPPAAAPQRTEDDRAGLRLERPDHRHSIELLSVIDWMLAPRPADRPQSVAEVRAALAGRGVPGRHAPPRRAQFAARLRQRKRWLWAGLALLVMAAAGAYVWRLWRTGMLPGQGG